MPSLKAPPSKKNPEVGVTTRRGHCVLNLTVKDHKLGPLIVFSLRVSSIHSKGYELFYGSIGF
jgi:hypothetical protein